MLRWNENEKRVRGLKKKLNYLKKGVLKHEEWEGKIKESEKLKKI